MRTIAVKSDTFINRDRMKNALEQMLQSLPAPKKVLIIPPDFTRYYSMAGELTQLLYEMLRKCATVQIMPALGTHMPMSEIERVKMFGQIPEECFLRHDWRRDTVCLGKVPKEFVAEISGGLFAEEIDVELNNRIINGGYDLILSAGQVVPHEVVGMANYSKNIFVGVGGRQMINKSHMLSAVCGIENALGVDYAPARRVFDYAQEKLLSSLPLVYMLTVTAGVGSGVGMRGLFIGDSRDAFEQAVKLSQELNITYLEQPARKVVAYLEADEFKTTWVGNKGIYRTRMAIADGGELVVMAPGVRAFGENEEVDKAIREFGYKGRDYVLDLYNKGAFANRMMVAAHLIHGSSDGRFSVTYATNPALLSKQEVESVGFDHMNIEDALALYNPTTLREGANRLPNGEEIYYVGAPALGLWKLK